MRGEQGQDEHGLEEEVWGLKRGRARRGVLQGVKPHQCSCVQEQEERGLEEEARRLRHGRAGLPSRAAESCRESHPMIQLLGP